MNTRTGSAPIAIEPDGELLLERGVGSRLGDFYELTKPRMNYLIVLTTLVGAYLASAPGARWLPIVHVVIGTALTAASAAVLNQFLERGYDALMERTRNRPIAAGRINLLEAVVFGSALGIAGLLYLAAFTNNLTALLGAVTLLVYLLIYTPLKRVSPVNTIVGAVPGAIPPLMGFTGVQDAITPGGLAVFLILFVWQIPHFLAIATMYREDYARGGFRMLPVLDPDLSRTARQIVVYSVALLPVSVLPWAMGVAGAVYLVASIALGLVFLWAAVRAARSRSRGDARRLFFASIVYLPLILAFLVADKSV